MTEFSKAVVNCIAEWIRAPEPAMGAQNAWNNLQDI